MCLIPATASALGSSVAAWTSASQRPRQYRQDLELSLDEQRRLKGGSGLVGAPLCVVARVAGYVPGYRLKNPPVFEEGPFATPGRPAAARVVALADNGPAGRHCLPADRLDPARGLPRPVAPLHRRPGALDRARPRRRRGAGDRVQPVGCANSDRAFELPVHSIVAQ
jgi:hypothetical protein